MSGDILVVGVYVDDLLVSGSCDAMIKEFKMQMRKYFEMSDMGLLNYYLGIEVVQSEGKIVLKQSAYAKQILQKAGMAECNSTIFPMEPKLKLGKEEFGTPVDPTKYRSIVGSLRYLTHTRPDITYVVGIVSRYMERPTVAHNEAVKHILRYVKGTLNHGLVYSKDAGNLVVLGYSDSDLAGNVDDRKSTTGMAFYFNGNLITWASQKQKVVALSTCEAEFMAATVAACQGIRLRNLVSQITAEKVGPVVLLVDNKSAIELIKNPVFHGRSKHIDVRFHFIRECVERGEIEVEFVRTEEQKADILTKALAKVKFQEMKKSLGVEDTTSLD